jgi:mlo protein
MTQMGSNMKKTIFEEQTANALMKWRREMPRRRRGNTTPSRGMSPNGSPVHLLNKFKGRSEDPQSAPTSPQREQQELGDMYLVVEQQRRAASSNAIDIVDFEFSFRAQR